MLKTISGIRRITWASAARLCASRRGRRGTEREQDDDLLPGVVIEGIERLSDEQREQRVAGTTMRIYRRWLGKHDAKLLHGKDELRPFATIEARR